MAAGGGPRRAGGSGAGGEAARARPGARLPSSLWVLLSGSRGNGSARVRRVAEGARPRGSGAGSGCVPPEQRFVPCGDAAARNAFLNR